MAPVHSDSVTDCPGTGKRKALLIAVKNNGVKGYRTLPHVHDDAKKLHRFLIGIQSICLLRFHHR